MIIYILNKFIYNKSPKHNFIFLKHENLHLIQNNQSNGKANERI